MNILKRKGESMEDLLKRINDKISDFQKDSAACVEKGNKAAGARSRKASSELTKLFKEWRQASLPVNRK